MRHAVYYTPPSDHPLTIAANAWLGRNAFDGSKTEITHPFAEYVEAPARYGFHGTLKAPFTLRDGYNHEDVADCMFRFCMENREFVLAGLQIGRIGPFFALIPSIISEELNRLAANAVEAFEPFRADLSSTEVARRQPEKLSVRQREYLNKWGYPYVLDEFRFHMTLTGPVPEHHRAEVEARLRSHFAEQIGKPHPVTSCALFIEPGTSQSFQIDTFSRLAT